MRLYIEICSACDMSIKDNLSRLVNAGQKRSQLAAKADTAWSEEMPQLC